MTDEVSKDPRMLAEAAAYRNRPSDLPPKMENMVEYKALAQTVFEANRSENSEIKFDDFWRQLGDDSKPGNVLGVMDEEEYRVYVKSYLWYCEARDMAARAEKIKEKAGTLVRALLINMQERLKYSDQDHLHINGQTGVVCSCDGGSVTREDLARALLDKLGLGK